MLHRSTSSRRRRASRSAANSPQGNPAPAPLGTRGRRASVAADRITVSTSLSSTAGNPSKERSPRGSIVPDIALDDENVGERIGQRMLPEIELEAKLRGSLQPEPNRSPRNSLVPDDYCVRIPHGSLLPFEPNRSPRNSLTPDMNRSPRNSLVPEGSARSPRHSLVPDAALSPRNSLVPEAAFGFNRSPRNSLVPESGRGGQQRGSPSTEAVATPTANRSPRGSTVPEPVNRSPRGSIVPEANNNRSPRGSICPESMSRGSRGAQEGNRSPRGSIAAGDIEAAASRNGETGNRSPRGSIGARDVPDSSPRGSLGGAQDRRSPRGSLTFQEPRRASADQGSSRNRSSSPYRQREREGNGSTGGSRQHPGNYGAQVNLGYGTNAWADSRRASSSVSQFSGDESRRLCAGISTLTEKGGGCDAPGTMTIATYGSLAFQLKDAHLEASGTLDFVARALAVVSKTLVVTICLACLSAMPLLMLIMGLQFIRDCPREPHIPVYMVVGGTLGGFRMLWTLYTQIRSRRPEVLSVPETRPHMSPTRLASVALSVFLVGWFVLGNFWILNIKWPDYAPTLFEPNRWCHKTLYVFSLVHLCVVYGTLAVGLLTAVALAFCRILACPWPDRYK